MMANEPTRNILRRNTTIMLSLVPSRKVNWSCCMIRNLISRFRKFKPMWLDSYIVKHVLAKGAYELIDFDEIPLSQPRNGL